MGNKVRRPAEPGTIILEDERVIFWAYFDVKELTMILHGEGVFLRLKKSTTYDYSLQSRQKNEVTV